MRRLINRQPERSNALLLVGLPFVLTVAAYLVASHGRLSVHEADQGNHFAAWQEPELLTEELRAAFRTFR